MSNRATKRVIVGRIAGVHGVHGWVKLLSHTAPPENILGYAPWLVEVGGEWREMRVAERRAGGGRLLVRLEGVDDRDQAARLIGAQVAVLRGQLPPIEEDTYYWADLVGLEVRNLCDESLGRVERLLETGANDVLVLAGARERLVPFVRGDVVKEVNLEEGVIRVDWDWNL